MIQKKAMKVPIRRVDGLAGAGIVAGEKYSSGGRSGQWIVVSG